MCMMIVGLRECDRLVEASNFILDDSMKVVTHVKKEAKEAKAKRILFAHVKDHFIPNIAKKKIGQEMLKALVGLF